MRHLVLAVASFSVVLAACGGSGRGNQSAIPIADAPGLTGEKFTR